jgi:hypothetical protein
MDLGGGRSHPLQEEDGAPVLFGAEDAPPYSPEDLAMCMPDYVAERGMLLRNGMQEFLFRFERRRSAW